MCYKQHKETPKQITYKVKTYLGVVFQGVIYFVLSRFNISYVLNSNGYVFTFYLHILVEVFLSP